MFFPCEHLSLSPFTIASDVVEFLGCLGRYQIYIGSPYVHSTIKSEVGKGFYVLLYMYISKLLRSVDI